MSMEQATRLRLIIERAKRGLSGRHDLVHAAMRAEFMSAVYSKDLPSAKAKISLDNALHKIGNQAAIIEEILSRQTAIEILNAVHPILKPEWFNASVSKFQKDVASQIGRDARAISVLFGKVQSTIHGLRGDKHLAAKAQALQHVNQPGVFVYKDSVGKIWTAERYLETHGAQFYYGLANELTIETMKLNGKASATVDRPGHKSDGLEIALADFDGIRERYFHPGSQAILI